jgi:DNA-binding LacI/PurR family transcriptional regulator
MGLIAAEMLLEKQHDPSAILGHIKVEEKLIIRETTGPVFSRPVK